MRKTHLISVIYYFLITLKILKMFSTWIN